MEVLYTNTGIPVLNIDGEAFRFNTDDVNYIVSALILNPDKMNQIKIHTINYIESLKNNLVEINQFSSYNEILNYMQTLSLILSLNPVFEILEDANSNYLKFTTEKPYNSWEWDRYKLEWVAPLPYPGVPGDNIYIWDEEESNWMPVATKLYPSWVWHSGLNEWVAPVSYPLDANPNDFKWDEDLGKWVANV